MAWFFVAGICFSTRATAAPLTTRVANRVLPGPYSWSEQRGQQLLVPVVVVGRALGDEVRVIPLERRIEVRRRTGVVATFEAARGEVRENGVPIFVSPGAAELPFPPDPEALLLPSEVVAQLLDVQVVQDPVGNTVNVSRDAPQVSVLAGGKRGFTDLYEAAYAYNASAAAQSFQQNLQAAAAGRVGEGRFNLAANFAGATGQDLFEYRYGLLSYDLPRGQRLLLGDYGTGADLSFLSSAPRGAWYRQPVGAIDVTTFAGAVRSGATLQAIGGTTQLGFDTALVGSYFTIGREREQQQRQALELSMGGMHFRGPGRQGGLLSSAFIYQTKAHQFRTELGIGRFDSAERRGTAMILDVSESLSPSESLTLLAGFSHVGTSFLAPEAASTLRPTSQFSLGARWAFPAWLTTSVGGRVTERLDRADLGTPVDQEANLSMTIALGDWWPTVLVSHSEGVQAEIGRRAFTLINASKFIGPIELFSHYSRSRFGAQPQQHSLTFGAGSPITPSASIRGFQTIATGNVLSGGLEVFSRAFLTERVRFGLGATYSSTAGRITTTQRALVSALLPGNQTLQLTYTQAETGGQAFIELRGPLYSVPQSRQLGSRSVESLPTVGTISGLVYQDIDLDGRFDPRADRALQNVQLLLDDTHSVLTDASGSFHLPNVQAGRHLVRVNLLTIRADLSLLSGAEHEILLPPDRDASVQFRLIRTGRISGVAWIDDDEDLVIDDEEELVADVRVTAGTRDTLTSSSGDFVIGDLPQGVHSVSVDEKTLPEDLEVARSSVQVTVVPPAETRDVLLPLRRRKAQIEIREFP